MHQPELELPIADSPRPELSAAELWATAIHEAGHAVVAVYFKIPFTCLYIRSNGNGGLILDRRKNRMLLESPGRVRYASKLIVTGYSGYIGHRKIIKCEPRGGVKYDAEHIRDLLWDTTRYERRLDKSTGCFQRTTEAEAEQIVNRRVRRLWRVAFHLVRKLFSVIQVVARALIERKRLKGAEVVALAGPLIAKERAALVHGLASGARTMYSLPR